jgi:hypothetical protein
LKEDWKSVWGECHAIVIKLAHHTCHTTKNAQHLVGTLAKDGGSDHKLDSIERLTVVPFTVADLINAHLFSHQES